MNKTDRSGIFVSGRRSDRSSVFELAAVFGCTLNGKDARLDVAPVSGLARVETLDRADRAHFNWSVACKVMREHKGNFVTRNVLEARQDFHNPVSAAMAALGL